MYIKTGGGEYPCHNYFPGADTVRFGLVRESLPTKLGETVALHQDDGLELARHRVADFKRWELEGDGLVLTNLPVPVPMPPEPPSVGAQISALKGKLAATDYQIIKCSEFQMAGLKALPYDIAALHVDRMGIRDEINRLELEK
ncbi:MAG: hypothetical protein RSB55_09010 [Oscillospiraceae bacterium]